MTNKIAFGEIENQLRHLRRSAQNGNERLFRSNAQYLENMVHHFIAQQRDVMLLATDGRHANDHHGDDCTGERA